MTIRRVVIEYASEVQPTQSSDSPDPENTSPVASVSEDEIVLRTLVKSWRERFESGVAGIESDLADERQRWAELELELTWERRHREDLERMIHTLDGELRRSLLHAEELTRVIVLLERQVQRTFVRRMRRLIGRLARALHLRKPQSP